MLSDSIVMWCNLCQSHPAEGKLTVIVNGEDHPIMLDSCEKCALSALDK